MSRVGDATKDLVERVKAAATILFTSSGAPAWPWTRSYAGSIDLGTVEEAANNSIVQACALWIQTTFPEAPIQVLDGRGKPVEDHPMVQLLDTPNPYYDGALLWQSLMADFTVMGNAYLLKVRSGAGRPVQLYWVPSWVVEPKWPTDGSTFISHYEYTPNGRPIRYEVPDVVHYRFGLDFATRKGVSRLRSVLGEVFTDREAQMFTASILKNLGVPGLMVIPSNDKVTVSKEVAEETRAEIESRFSSTGRGRAMVARAPIDVKVLSYTPEQMQLKDVRRIPEERISAVIGIPAGVAGLGAGLDRNTYNNVKEAREQAYESNIIPTQRIFAAATRRQLLVDFTDDKRQQVAFDQSKVRVLQDDQDKLVTRTNTAWRGGIIDMAEARTAVGQKSTPDMEGVYLVSGTTSYKKLDDLLNPPEPPTAPSAPPPNGQQQPANQQNGNHPPQDVQQTKELAGVKAKNGRLDPDEVERLFAERWAELEGEEPE